jgi:hypothetical protein
MSDKKIDFTPVITKYHTHAELAYGENPEQIVYKEKDVVKLLTDCIVFCSGFGFGKGCQAAGLSVPAELSVQQKTRLWIESIESYIEFFGAVHVKQMAESKTKLEGMITKLESSADTLSEADTKRLAMYKRFLKYY